MIFERTTVRLPSDLMRRVRQKAATSGHTLTALIEEGLRHVVDQQPKVPRLPRRLPRISAAGGGLLAGVDLDRSATVQEIEDVDEAARTARLA